MIDRDTVVGILVIVAVVAVVTGFFPLDLVASKFTHEYHDALVVDKYIKRYHNHDKFFVVIKTKDGRTVILQNTDSWAFWKWNSADIQAQIQIGKRYNFYTYGWRIPFLSLFENIYKVEPVS